MITALELYDCEILNGNGEYIEDFTLKVPVLDKQLPHADGITSYNNFLTLSAEVAGAIGYSGIIREGIFGGRNVNVNGFWKELNAPIITVIPQYVQEWYNSFWNEVFGNIAVNSKYLNVTGVQLREKATQRIINTNSLSWRSANQHYAINFIYKINGSDNFYQYTLDLYEPQSYGGAAFYNGPFDPVTTSFVPGGTPTKYDNVTNPYLPVEDSQPGGGTGTFSGTSTPIPVPNLPTLSALSTGFISIYAPSNTQLENLCNYLWSNAFDLNSFKKIFANPIDTIMGFSIVPFAPEIAGNKEVKVGNIGTGINMSYVTKQHYEFDFGTVRVPEEFGSYLDYEPYVNFELYLPYIGIVKIDVDDIRKNYDSRIGTIQVKYHVDILSGALVAYVICNGTCVYQYSGSCLVQLPLTGSSFNSMYQSIINVASTVIGGIASGGLKGGVGAVLGNAGNVASNVSNMKPNISRSGGMGSTCGLMGVQTPYLIINQPIIANAGWQNAFMGYPAHITRKIGTIIDEEGGGYAEFEKIYIDNVPCTDKEKQELLSLFAEGVIL